MTRPYFGVPPSEVVRMGAPAHQVWAERVHPEDLATTERPPDGDRGRRRVVGARVPLPPGRRHLRPHPGARVHRPGRAPAGPLRIVGAMRDVTDRQEVRAGHHPPRRDRGVLHRRDHREDARRHRDQLERRRRADLRLQRERDGGTVDLRAHPRGAARRRSASCSSASAGASGWTSPTPSGSGRTAPGSTSR